MTATRSAEAVDDGATDRAESTGNGTEAALAPAGANG